MGDTSLTLKIQAADSASTDPVAADRKRILLVEGDGFTRLVLLLRLRLVGFGVDFTSNGTLGLGKLRSCHPDILLVDLKLCGLSGLELIKAARAEPGFGNRPIYVFTRADKMNRATRKEVGLLATEVFDKSSVTREDLVQIFATKLLPKVPAGEQPATGAATEQPVPALSEVVVTGALEGLIAGVREQAEMLAKQPGSRVACGSELLSRVSSLTSCAKAAGLAKLTRQAKALESFLTQLCRNPQGYTDAALVTISRAVEVMSRMSFEPGANQKCPARFSTVFIDEAPYSNRAMEEALLNAGFDPVCFEDPVRAREYLGSNRTELIIANVVLPEAHGLSVADIRQLSLHGKTLVLFGPESPYAGPSREELPTSAPRLDKAPLLLTELVLRALNELQSPQTPPPASKPVAAAAPPTAPQPFSAAKPAVSLPGEDCFELFAQAPRHEPAPEVNLPVNPVPVVSADANQLPNKFSHLFTVAGIPEQPIMRAEPSAPGPDGEVEFAERLPAPPEDATQIDERPEETLPPSSLQAEVPQEPQPEPTAEDQTAAATWLAASPDDNGQPILPENSPSEFPVSEPGAAEESAATPILEQAMNHQFQAAPAEFEQNGADPNDQLLSPPSEQRMDLATRVCEAEMALYHARIELDAKDKAIGALKTQLAENKGLAGAGTSDNPTQGSAAEQKAQARCAELEQEVAALRQAFADFNGNFGQQQQVSADAGKRVEELEQRLNQTAAEQAKQAEQQGNAEAELRRQLDETKSSSQQNEAARQQAEARCSQFEQELNNLRKSREESPAGPAQEQKLNAETAAPGKQGEKQATSAEPWVGVSAAELEQQVRQGVTALARATAELAKERGERQRSQQLAAELNGRLQGLHQDLSRTLQTQGENLSRLSALEQEQRQTSQALERCTADLEQQQAERRSAEEQFQKLKETNAQLRKDLSFFEEINKKFGGATQELQSRLEANLNAARENESRIQNENAERQKLEQKLEEALREIQSQSRKRESLEQELQNVHHALQEREAKLQNKAVEQQRLNQELDSVQHGLLDRPERDLEFSKLQSALQLEQIERKRQETQLARMRQSALDSAHAARSLRTSLRRQIREPVDNLVQSARTLLELEMDDNQKRLAEAVLQDVLLVQTRLREPGAAHTEPAEAAAPPITPAT